MEEKQITLQIDRHYITVPEGSTILEAARKIGIDIPTLCHIDLKGTCVKNNPASCRICVVEVEGRRNLAPACATRCTEGMVVRTSTLRVMNARKVVRIVGNGRKWIVRLRLRYLIHTGVRTEIRLQLHQGEWLKQHRFHRSLPRTGYLYNERSTTGRLRIDVRNKRGIVIFQGMQHNPQRFL